MATRLSSRLLIHLPAPTAAVTTTSPRLRKPTAALTASYRRCRPRLAVLAGAAPSGGAVAPAAPAGENREAGLTPAEAQRLEEFLKADLPHLFDDVGIDRSAYDDRVRFRDPITRYDDIDGYLANIRLLKVIFRPDFYLHDVKQVSVSSASIDAHNVQRECACALQIRDNLCEFGLDRAI